MIVHQLPEYIDPARHWSATWTEPQAMIVVPHGLGSRNVHVTCLTGDDLREAWAVHRLDSCDSLTVWPGPLGTIDGTGTLELTQLTPEELARYFPLTVVVTA